MISFEQLFEAKIIGKIDLGNKVKSSDLNQLEKVLDKLFASANIDIEFTKHFLDRINNKRNKEQITINELRQIFTKTYKKYKDILSKSDADFEAVLNDLQTDLNIPFVLIWDKKNNELDLVSKTIMRKKNFKTSNKKFKV